jgi:hypothetical protein
MDIEIKNKLLEVIQKIRTWDPEEDSAETLLTLCDEFDEIKPAGTSLDDWTDITQLGCAAEYKERVDRKLSYPIHACDFDGNCMSAKANGISNI